ncbi:MAG: M23 family metallopeptidase, partial [Hyphomicrobiales bacterium]|nr:M23 family metallopeptidase [Hyphomicrobiales bacterium]
VTAFHGDWSAAGGTPIVLAQGETLKTISTRYGVPVSALMRVNGFHSASDAQPGSRLIIPVYNANGKGGAKDRASHVASADAPSPPSDHALRRPRRLASADNSLSPIHALRDGKPPKKKALAGSRDLAAADASQDAAQDAADPAPRGRLADAPKAAQLRVADAAPAVARAAPAAAPDAAATSHFQWPAHGRVIAAFKPGRNDGINIAVPDGTKVRAAEGGVVAYAGSEIKGYGNLILIRHPDGYVSAYANNGKLDVKKGEAVRRGQVIALSGQTGDVATPQLHFELRKGTKPVDPSQYLAGL